jgi:hypothetical protein
VLLNVAGNHHGKVLIVDLKFDCCRREVTESPNELFEAAFDWNEYLLALVMINSEEDTRLGGPIPMAMRNPQLAAMVRQRGGDALLLSSDNEHSTYNIYEFAQVKRTHCLSLSRRRQAKAAVDHACSRGPIFNRIGTWS